MEAISYPENRETEIEWLKEIPGHWDTMRLRFAIKSNPVKSEVADIESDKWVSFVPMDAVGEYGGMTPEKDRFIGDVYSGYTYFKNNDVVVAKITPCFENGKGAIAENMTNEIGFGTTEFHVLRALEGYDYRWLFYLTITYPFRKIGASEMLGAGGQKRIPETFIKDFRVGFPPPEEQQKIAKFLDHKTGQIDQLIAKKKALIEKLDEKRIAVITQAVTKGLDPTAPMRDSEVEWLGEVPEHWEVRRLKECSELISKGTTPSTEGLQVLDQGKVRFIKAENIVRGFIRKKPSNFIDEYTNFVLRRSILQEGDILFVIAGATLGKVAFVTKEHLPANTNQAVAFVRPTQEVNTLYLYYWLQSYVIKEMTWLYAVQSAQPNLAMGVLGNFVTLLPSEEEQELIVEHISSEINKNQKMIGVTQKTIDRLVEYRTTLITAAVTGKIDVRNVEVPQEA